MIIIHKTFLEKIVEALGFMPGPPAGATWGEIIGDIEDQNDLTGELNSKINGDGINKITVSLTAPVNPSVGDIWIETN
jgi:hypothetical protein